MKYHLFRFAFLGLVTLAVCWPSSIAHTIGLQDSTQTRARVLYNQGLASLNAGKYESAVDSCRQATRIRPDFYDAYYLMASYMPAVVNIEMLLRFMNRR